MFFLAGGRIAYYGSPSECVKAFAGLGFHCPIDYNPADLVIEKLAVEPGNEEECRERIQRICEAFDESAEGRHMVEAAESAGRSTSDSTTVVPHASTAPYFLQVGNNVSEFYYNIYFHVSNYICSSRAQRARIFVLGFFCH